MRLYQLTYWVYAIGWAAWPILLTLVLVDVAAAKHPRWARAATAVCAVLVCASAVAYTLLRAHARGARIFY